jgi:hypothetical protein
MEVRLKRHANRRSGQTALLFTLGLTTMLGLIGLVSDVGFAYYRKEVAQAAAQSAAMATVKAAMSMSGGACGTNNVLCQSSSTSCPSSISGYGTTNIDKGCLYAQTNGFTTSTKQNVSIKTGTGAYNGVSVTYWAEVVVSEKLPQLFSMVTGNSTMNLAAKSAVGYIPPSNGGCIWVTAPTGSSLTTNGNTSLNTGCSIQVNSSDANALNLSGGNTTISVTGTSNGITNGVNIVGGYSCYGQSLGCVTPTPTLGVASGGDPMSGIDPPTDGVCTTPPTLKSKDTLNVSNPTGTLTYCGMVSVGSNSTLNLAAGTYIFKNDGSNSCGLSATSQGNITGTNVFLYFENPCAVSFTGNGNVTLSAPTSGTYQGVTIFQARDDAATASLTGGSTQLVGGVVYFPDALLKFSGNGTSTNNAATTSIVAYNLQLNGNAYIANSGSSPYLVTFAGYAVFM